MFTPDLSDVVFTALAIMLGGFLNSAGEDLWAWLRNFVNAHQEPEEDTDE